MKRTRNSIYDFSLNQINPKLFMFGLIAIMTLIIFYSCSTGDESINKSGKTETITASEKTKKIGNTETGLDISVQENLNSFSEQTFTSVESLEIALYKNSYVGFNAQAMQMLNAATNENDLKSAFEMAGIANSQEVINILKNNVTIQQQFISENPDFYNLTIEKRVELLDASIVLAENNYFSQIPLPYSGSQAESSCSKAWRKNRNRCLRDYGVCSVGSIAAAFIPPFWPALVGAAICLASKVNCESDAKQDWLDCDPVLAGTPPPPTGELTIHCTDMRSAVDSCWTTDSNGKYVGRVD